MLRKIAVGLAAFGALNAAQVKALGLGEVTVHSALNQPLQAEIDLLQIRDLTSSQIIAGLADADEFYLAGVKPTAVLSDLSFELELNNSGGRLVLKTREPIREPFLNFLVEVNWPSGRLVKEYTLLLDPPVFSAQDLAPRSTPSAPTAQSVPFTVARPAPVAAPERPSAVTMAPVNQSSATASPSQYRVGANDTLWNIALDTRPDRSISPQQMMLAIQRANPDAFIGNNINRLKSGVVLDIPSMADIAALASTNPVMEVQRQNKAWRGAAETGKPEARSEQLDAGADRAVSETDTVVNASQLRIASKEQLQETKPEAAEMPLVSSDTQSGSGDEPDAVDEALMAKNRELEEQLVVTLEGLDKVERDNAELFDRLDRISKQMESMQRLIELKDQQLAELQNRAPEPAAAPASQPAPAGAGIVDTLMKSPAMLGGIGAGILALLGGLFWFLRKRKQDAVDEEQAVEEALAVLDAQQSAPETNLAAAATATVATVAATAAAAAAEPEPSEWDAISEDEVAVDEDPNDPFNAVSDEDVNEFDALDDLDIEGALDMDLKIDEPVKDELDLDQFSESLLNDDDFDLSVEESEPADSELDALDKAVEDEVEPVASEGDSADELDAILDQQEVSDDEAAGMLEDDLDALLAENELDSGTDSDAEIAADAAESLEDDLDAILAGDGDDEFTENTAQDAAPLDDVDELDRLLAEESGDDEIIEGGDLGIEDDTKAESLKLDKVDPIEDDVESLDDESIQALLDSDQEEDSQPEDTIDLEALSSVAVDDADDVDLTQMDLESDSSADEVPPADDEPALSLQNEDDDLTVGELLAEEEAEPEPVADVPEEMESTLELEDESAASTAADALLNGLPEDDDAIADFDALAAEFDDEVQPKATTSSLQLEDDALDSAADDDLEAELSQMLEQEDNELTLDESDGDGDDGFAEGLDYLEDADEAGTKLDLARAYIDMDDTDGAADILAEVVREGSEEQVAEAQKLLDSLKS